ncbi:ABC transporter ATP-binding protein [Lactiplantibacillus mudanjiangensis]|uniref:ABC-type multidrug transport system, ATPase component [Lactobacillus brevis ATCC 367] n=1 Tax=Lactiplantibacillus mudanjiangensis TaxID=1296538 RepID=A0A660E2Q3_9LACO|nr:ABC transporter ATP-binding protein [Lactiplantibacillus mudanjiangensis]VDG20418.1 ABC-type multidrug transport system, ATPase component [Lactobacillus brevis ATCC 367] [Lactiplantibacillus mudanjiangensis]VDG25219.1 ABC-type multidrug transport system, ATPase component [Lactobacillus brevis ATCC 367] [Lactiplantibacillus mudanjiangensis]VDG30386.1 ABC-type multidrug transport system, ATPase component [Lactobacillus brevis ATCC 367] [Lactiplantibacillus mudanjiangensis]
MATAIIDLQHLAKTFGKQTVLKDINLTVNAGEIVGLIGPSGAGKSTVIKVTLGMEVASGGSAKVFDTQMPNRQLLSRIGYMAQTDALYDSLSGYENLKFYGQMKGISKDDLPQAIQHVAEVVDLTKDLKKRVAGYSGGMMRRLSLAIALLGDPDLLILDEPTVGIDPALRRQIWAELGRIRDAGRSILITTHVMDEAELVDRVALLLDGKVMAFDEPVVLKHDYGVDSIEDVFLKAEGVD